jgi:hypothetical protein
MALEKGRQCAFFHPLTDETKVVLVADAQKGDDIGMPQMPPGNHLVAEGLSGASAHA